MAGNAKPGPRVGTVGSPRPEMGGQMSNLAFSPANQPPLGTFMRSAFPTSAARSLRGRPDTHPQHDFRVSVCESAPPIAARMAKTGAKQAWSDGHRQVGLGWVLPFSPKSVIAFAASQNPETHIFRRF